MAGFGPIQRPSINSQAYTSIPQKDPSMAPSKKDQEYSFNFMCPFSIPQTSEAAVIRIVKNMVFFGLYYLLFIYIVLFITLIPQRKVSLVYLVAMKEVAFLYLILIRAVPNSSFLHKIIDKRFVLFLLCIAAGVAMILTGAGIHLLITLVSTIPVVLVHATFWREELCLVNGDEDRSFAAAGEFVPIEQNNSTCDATNEPTNLV
ncbi:hypothetical protein ACH5RR_023731 [Cinchona calisaya]|uniref:PRA1 family protein n=1 Tax=Cinchona calisaya TaxID=153742 RepID=A0ABD2ZCK6_9GENT